MILVRNRHTDPAFNLAAEEYLSETAAEDTFILWQNGPSVIIGKNQNPYAEVDLTYAAERGIPVVRRMTGGGAVFHDTGNINFSFINISDVRALDFNRFTEPIVAALRDMGVACEADGRNDIVTPRGKISGNAQLVRRRGDGREVQLHHGTLLFSANTDEMGNLLKPRPEKLASKGVESVRSRVCNISDLPEYTGPRDVGGFIRAIEEKMGGAVRDIGEYGTRAIEQLAEAKYRSWAWNFGASPKFSVEKTARIGAGTVTVMLDSAEGRITGIKFYGDYFGSAERYEGALVGCRMEYGDIMAALAGSDGIHGAAASEIARLITD